MHDIQCTRKCMLTNLEVYLFQFLPESDEVEFTGDNHVICAKDNVKVKGKTYFLNQF